MSEDDDDRHRRTATEVAQRCLALLMVVQRCREGDPAELIEWAKRSGVIDYLSGSERRFVFSAEPDDRARVEFSWRAEGVITLLWALNRIEEMPPANEQVDLLQFPEVQNAADDPGRFVASAFLRPPEELSSAEEEFYNHHWEVRDAQLFGRELPPGLDAGVVYERRYALSWVVGWGDDWDEVPTDT